LSKLASLLANLRTIYANVDFKEFQ